jgi:hypothetical protein
VPPISQTLFDNFGGLVQIQGSLGRYSWFFRARGTDWQFHLVEVAGRLATTADRHIEDYWDEGRYTGVLSNAEATSLVNQCLDKYWQIRGQKRYYSRTETPPSL